MSNDRRTRTGSVEPNKRADGSTYFRARIWLGDKTRVRVDVPQEYATPAGGMTARDRAEIYAEVRQEREDETGELLAAKRARSGAGTVSSWFREYYKAAERGAVGRKNRGKPQSSVAARRSRFDTWIEQEIGAKPMGAVTPADLRRIVQKLDAAVLERGAFYESDSAKDAERKGRKPGLSAKTASSVWGEITSGFKEACHSKLDALRVLATNPALGVLPPTTGDDREQAALFPLEILTLLATPTISRTRRRTYFGALYTGCRRSELARITAAEVDLEHDIITVRGTKSDAAKRQIPIEPALRVLLEILVCARPTGPLFDVPRGDGNGGSSDLVAKDLKRAGLDRGDLHRDDASHMPFTFHGLRHTAITHWAIAGRPQSWLQLVAGHTDTAMTMRYLDSAAVVRGRFGQPHPQLPDDALTDLLADALADVLADLLIELFADLRPSRRPSEGRTKPNRPEPFDSSLDSHGHLVTPMGIEPMFPT